MVDTDPLPDPFAGNSLAHINDDARAFVPEYLRRVFRKQTLGDVDIGAADAGGVEFNEDVAL